MPTYYSANYFTVTGGESDYTISFEGESPGYMDQEHVGYYIGTTIQDNAARTFLTATSIRIDPVPADGTVISFRRLTSPTEALVDWLAGASVTEVNLDKVNTQMLYLTQESADAAFIDTAAIEASEINAAASAAAALVSENNASDHEDDAAAEVVLAAAQVTLAEAEVVKAETAVTNAETAETNAETAETGAEAAEAKAEDWAEEIEDTEVETGKYSALHWAAKSETAAGTALQAVIDDPAPEFGANVTGGGKVISDIIFKDSAEVAQDLGSVSSTQECNLATGNIKLITIGGNVTFTFTNPPVSGKAGFLILEITNGGAYTITWPASVEWDGGDAPELQVSGVDIITFITRDAGTTWRAVRGWKEA